MTVDDIKQTILQVRRSSCKWQSRRDRNSTNLSQFFLTSDCVWVAGGGLVFPFNFHRLPSLIQLVAVEYKSRLTLNLSSKTAPPGNDWSKSLLPIIQLVPDPETGIVITEIFEDYINYLLTYWSTELIFKFCDCIFFINCNRRTITEWCF